MVELVKVALRIKSSAFDEEINDLIRACKADLKISGVKNIKTDDPLINQAIKTYCKANFWTDNKDSDKFEKSYELLKQHLSLCGEYNE